MAYNSLADFVQFLENKRQLKIISVEVNPILEITEIADRAVKDSGPALLFENVKGSRFPLLINAFGSYQRMAWSLGVDHLDEIAKQIRELLRSQPPSTFVEKLKMLPKLFQLSSYAPKTVGHGTCQDVVLTGDDVDLDIMPIMKCWPDDAERYFTLPLVITKDPDTGIRNVGMYRMQVFDKKTTGMHWQIHKVGARHYRRHCELNARMPVAVTIGGDPANTYASTAPMPDPFDEFLLSGFLRKKAVELVRCKTIDLEVPADSDFVLEGYVDPGELRTEGKFGDHTGFYSLEEDYPVFHITAITHKKDPIYFSTIVGKPPMEDAYMGKATERLFLPLIQMTIPEIVDINMPIEGVFHNIAIVSIKKQFPGHAQKVMYGLWGLGQMSFAKCIMVVDEDVDVQNLKEVTWRVGNNIDPRRDTIFVDGPVDALDHASQKPCMGSKIGIDATKKLPEEGFTRRWPDVIKMSDDVKKKIDEIWKDLGI